MRGAGGQDIQTTSPDYYVHTATNTHYPGSSMILGAAGGLPLNDSKQELILLAQSSLS
jgi:hypothetical protein